MSSRLPAVTPKQALRALKRAGFFVARTSGSHHLLVHPDRPQNTVTVAYHAKDLKPKTLRSIIRQAGLTVEEFRQYL